MQTDQSMSCFEVESENTQDQMPPIIRGMSSL